MAIVFSLTWASLIWSYVHSYSKFHLNFFHGIADISDRMLLFLAAVILFSWSVSNLRSRIFVASILALVFSLLVGCMWTIWDSSGGLGVWLHGLRDGIMSFRNCFYIVTTDNGSERELADPGDGVISGTV